MMPHRLAEQRARGLPISGIENERAEIVQRGEIGRPAPDEFEIVALGLLERALLAQQAGAFEARLEASRIARNRGSRAEREIVKLAPRRMPPDTVANWPNH